MADCRSCGNRLAVPFLSLGTSPLSNSYLMEDGLHRMEPHYPLELFVCDKCYLVQLLEFEMVQNIFSADYAYYSSYSTSWLQHCERYTEMIIQKLDLDERSFVMEVASNDGYLLQFFKKRNIQILGVEPAEGVARIALEKGIPTDIAFFNTDYAEKIMQSGQRADLIVGNNVLAHNPCLNDFVEALRIGLRERGVITMEFPHLLKMLQLNQFDTIYHEHYSYFSLYSVLELFKSHSLEIFDVDELPTHGGSLRIYAQHSKGGRHKKTAKVASLLEREKAAGILDMGTYLGYGEKVMAIKRRLLEFLIKAKDEGKVVVAYGAPAKGNTLLNYCGIRTDLISYTVDRSPHKQGKFLPGSQIPIMSPEQIIKDRPDFVLILPWNLKEEIMEQMKEVREWGGRFVIPIPFVQVI